MNESDIDVKFSDGTLTIKGEKRDEKEEKKKGNYLSERRYGLFQRSFGVPDGADVDKIEANFKKRRAHGHVAENAAGPDEREENLDQKGLSSGRLWVEVMSRRGWPPSMAAANLAG